MTVKIESAMVMAAGLGKRMRPLTATRPKPLVRVGGKRIMKLIGFDLGPNRTPFRNMTDEEEQAMKKELEAIHFFDRCNKF